MKKFIPNTWINSKKVDMYAGWTFYVGLLAIIGFWSFNLNNAIWLTAGICAIIIAVFGIISSQIRKNLIIHLCDFDSEKALALNEQYLYSTDAFPAYWDDSGSVYLVLHPIKNPDEVYVFVVPMKWYESIQEMPKHMATNFSFESAQSKHHKLHVIGLSGISLINHFVLQTGEEYKLGTT